MPDSFSEESSEMLRGYLTRKYKYNRKIKQADTSVNQRDPTENISVFILH